MASAQVVETSVANNSPSQNSNHPDDLFQSRKVKQVDMLLGTSVSRLETHKSCVESVYGDFKMDANLVKVNKGELLTLDSPNYDSVIAKYPDLKGVKLRDHDTKLRPPVHIIFGAGEYARF